MNLRQRDVVYVYDDLPYKGAKEHPFVVLSCKEAIDHEDYFTGVMMTGTPQDDQFSFPLSDDMFVKPLNKISEIRLHIIGSFRIKDIRDQKVINRMKKQDFINVLNQIDDLMFWVDEDDE